MAVKLPLSNPLSKEQLNQETPEIIFANEPNLTEFVRQTWYLAYEHVKTCPGAPQSPFMDEAFAPDRIWIWDTCFMTLFCKYAPHIFPGIASLDNFYAPMLDHKPTPLLIHIPDNPPLFAWAEREYYKMTNDNSRITDIFIKNRYPQRMYELFNSFRAGDEYPYSYPGSKIRLEQTSLQATDSGEVNAKTIGFHWTGGRCGMDNTPRGDLERTIIDNDPAYRNLLFVDAIAQQALSAKIIADLTADTLQRKHSGEVAECRAFSGNNATYYQEEYAGWSKLINDYYWDAEDGCYYDIRPDNYEKIKVLTPASYWPLLAGCASPEQAAQLARHADNQEQLGGDIPFSSVARNSRHFEPDGGYWRGGVWLPTAYMMLKALTEYGFTSLADKLGEKLVMHQYRTWRDFTPHTIWEAYSPTRPEPASCKYNSQTRYTRPDFCGWSALGPINVVIEHVLGIEADAVKSEVNWRLHQSCRHGIRNLRFGDICCSLIYANSQITVATNAPFRLILPNSVFDVISGSQTFNYPKIPEIKV